ncbi:MAG: hypothetical protein R3246_05335 [Acidimicrobiia bacterium]|nr:hypothetical protein [Acidimicrobiia bacterium]
MTTEAKVEVIDICPRGLVWEIGQTYAADCFIVPVSFHAIDSGWRSYGASAQAVRVERWTELREPLVGIQIMAYRPDLPPTGVFESLLGIDGVDPVAGPSEDTIAGRPAVVADVDTAPDPTYNPVQDTYECSPVGFSLQWGFDNWPGYPLMLEDRSGGTNEFGLGACYRFRIWVVELAGSSITIAAIVFDPDRFDELIGDAEELLATLAPGG